MALPQIVPSTPLRPLEWVTPPARREAVLIESQADQDGPLAADVYRLGGQRRRPGIVMALGANDLGSRDPRAVALADTLARSGFVVLVMSGAPMLNTPENNDPSDLVRAPGRAIVAFDYLAQRPDVDAARVGFVGVCLGGGTCLLAASQPAVAERVGFVYLIGPYYSLHSLVSAAASGTSVDENGRTRRWPVGAYGLGRLRAWLLQALDAEDRARVRRALELGETAPDDLSPAGSATLQLCRGVSLGRADALISLLDERFQATLTAASPKGQLAGLRAPTFILHGRADHLVPVEESRRLACALLGQVPVNALELELFEHVDATRRLRPGAFAREVWRLAGHVALLMQFAG
jgi:acetyl esterase/lipase